MKNDPYNQFFKKRKDVFIKKTNSSSYRSPKKPTSTEEKSKSQSLWLGLVACVLAGGSGWYLYIGDKGAAEIFDKVEISILGQANAEENSAETKGKGDEKSAAASATTADGKSVPKKVWTDEEINLFSKLEARKAQLDTREGELAKLEEELQKQKAELEKRLADLNDVRDKISAKLDDRVKVDGHKVDSLVLVYANMKPAQAAKVIGTINEDLAVEVLSKMKNKNAAEILNLMDQDTAKKISERFAGYREPASK